MWHPQRGAYRVQLCKLLVQGHPVHPYIHPSIQADGQTNGQTDGQTNGWTDGQDREIRSTGKYTQTRHRQADKQTDRPSIPKKKSKNPRKKNSDHGTMQTLSNSATNARFQCTISISRNQRRDKPSGPFDAPSKACSGQIGIWRLLEQRWCPCK